MTKTLFIKLDPRNRKDDAFIQVIVAPTKEELVAGGTFASVMKANSSKDFLLALKNATANGTALDVEMNVTTFTGPGHKEPLVNTWINEVPNLDEVFGV